MGEYFSAEGATHLNALLVPVFVDVFHLCIEALQTRVTTFRSPVFFGPAKVFTDQLKLYNEAQVLADF